METRDEVVEIESLEKGLLSSEGTENGDYTAEEDDSTVIYAASFDEMEENFVKYQTAQWVLYSLVSILAWGIGLLMLLYVPVRRFILRKDIRSRKLYVTPDAIVYKVTRPVAFPCFGVLQKEKYVLLPSVADIVIEQGYLQSFFGVYSVRIENAGVRRPPSDDLQIQGITNPSAFRKAVLTHLSSKRTEASSTQVPVIEGPQTFIGGHPQVVGMSPSQSVKHDAIPPNELGLLQKLEVGTSIKRVQNLIEQQYSQAETSD
ncbi:uncharacterized protein LOC110721807 [Chenopodium quinoa]|uniref:DUF7642 domain-containing protein n=1 Tax=Chenopodium quinoa TaxID=63459 RepID=A0A803MF65_CHEQI|nr:uncharacterized protein LOC110721807 [Chenopodium quinoa]XP_021756697.1 uncharacterized protein LOC110721807 [Chenopodium quinoa]